MNKNEEEINKLATTLKARGIASSMTEALEKARSIMQGIDMPTPQVRKTYNPPVECSSCSAPEKREEPKQEIKEMRIETEECLDDEKEKEDPRISQIDSEVSVLEAKNDAHQKKIMPEEDDYDIMGDDRTLSEILGEAKEEQKEEQSNESEKSNDEFSEENDKIEISNEGFEEDAEEIDAGNNSAEDSSENEDFIGSAEEEKEEKIKEEEIEEEPERPTLTAEEKKMSDLSSIFNFSKMKKK